MLELADTMGQRIVLPTGRARERSERLNPSLAEIGKRERSIKPLSYIQEELPSETKCSPYGGSCFSCDVYSSCPVLKI
jgi:hypothetical protein